MTIESLINDSGKYSLYGIYQKALRVKRHFSNVDLRHKIVTLSSFMIYRFRLLPEDLKYCPTFEIVDRKRRKIKSPLQNKVRFPETTKVGILIANYFRKKGGVIWQKK